MKEYIFKLAEALVNEETGQAVFKPEVVGELIRCKDCKCNDYGFCYVHEFIPKDDYYCNFAERKEND